MTQFHNGSDSNAELSCQFARSLLSAIEKKYGALISAARKDWERKFSGRDPADSCVTVRVSAGKSQEEFSRLFPFEVLRADETFVTN
jgi:hypothetical protein